LAPTRIDPAGFDPKTGRMALGRHARPEPRPTIHGKDFQGRKIGGEGMLTLGLLLTLSRMKKSFDITPNIEALFGTRDENLHVLEDGLNINIDLRSNSVEVEGAPRDVSRAEQVFADYEHLQRSGFAFQNGDLNSMLRVVIADPKVSLRSLAEAGKQRSLGRRTVQPKSLHQRCYLDAIENHDMVFGIGPAGTGKTYLAVAMAISALLSKRVNRIILARPAVEAGERLGFLPGTLQEKIDPYLRPLYDALYDMLEPEKVDRYLEKNVIEIAGPDPQRFLRDSRRGAEHHFRADEDVRNSTGLQLESRNHRRHYADRFAERATERIAGSHRCSQRRGRLGLLLFR